MKKEMGGILPFLRGINWKKFKTASQYRYKIDFGGLVCFIGSIAAAIRRRLSSLEDLKDVIATLEQDEDLCVRAFISGASLISTWLAAIIVSSFSRVF